ncbi:ATP-binding protein [Pusillimonas sp. ANT_WB101]|uniref:sensor histidine kinase n=1 Tax=Pusillimonas sp. ANT_WB101 TaxID=2597356 RepID=UPI0011ECBD1A|nr:ATP-binding protein [Pusillimonas sp. ANT_WB101]KAA0890759.1 histidine kinase [Pusillimonas sp. ANT_WB101]
MMRLLLTRPLLCLLLCLWAIAQASAAGPQGVLHITDPNFKPIALEYNALVYEDASAEMGFDDIRQLPVGASKGFVPMQGNASRARYSRSAWWLKLTLVNNTSETLPLRFASDTSSITYLDFFQSMTGNSWSHTHSGEAVPLSEQPLGVFRREAFPVVLMPGQQTTIFVRIQSDKALMLAPRLYSEKSFTAHEASLSLWNGLLIGGLLALTVGALHVTVFSRSRAFAWLTALSLVIALYEMSGRGYSKLFLWPESTDWAVRATPVFGYASLAMFLIFVMSGARLLQIKLSGKAWLVALVTLELGLAALAATGQVHISVRLGYFVMVAHAIITIVIAVVLIKRSAPAGRIMLMITLFFTLQTALRFSGDASFLPEWVTVLNMRDSTSNPVTGLLGLYINLAFLAAWIVIVAKQRRRAERALLEHQTQAKNRLQTEVERQTEALNSALQYANEKNQQKTETLSYIGHDLRAPLATIAGYAQLLDIDKKPSQAQYIRAIERSAQYQLTLIDELLDYAKNELHPLNLNPEPTSLTCLLEDVTNYMAALSAQHNNTFACTATSPIPAQIVIDQRRLLQVLLNLVSNAAKFTQHGHIALNLSAVDNGRKHWTLTFSVSDSGIGIASEQQTTIFSAFTQERSSYGGLGLGLFIAQRIVENMGGTISLDSALGLGSTFSFSIKTLATGDAVAWSQSMPSAANVITKNTATTEHLMSTPLPPAYERMTLAKLARDGQLTEIEEWLMNMHAALPDCAPFFHRIQDLLATLDLEKIESLALAPTAHQARSEDAV